MATKSALLPPMPPGFDLGQAILEANRCLLCYDPPCSKGCPGGTDPGRFIKKLRLRNITGAIRTIKTNNILGGACGILCPTARLCEKECRATGLLDHPIQIGKIQRALIEHSWHIGFSPLDKAPRRPEKIAVIGSGPAGLACAAELAKEGFPVTIFEARPKAGGVLRYGVPSYRFAPEFLDRELQDLVRLGVTFKCGRPIRGRGALAALKKQGFAAIFLGPGLWEPVALQPGRRRVRGIWSATKFLSALKEGKSAAMARHIRGRRVAVIGGGSVAMDCAESALRLKARDVYVVYRRSYAQMPAEEDEKQLALQNGIHFLLLNQAVDYLADKKGHLQALRLRRTELGKKDDSGRRRPVEIAGSEWNLPAEIVIEAIGVQPAADTAWDSGLRRTPEGLIVADPQTGATSLPGVYAGGDIVRGPALIIEAIRDGKAAAQAIRNQLLRSKEEAP